MKTINEIQDRIHDLETELASAREWADKAYNRYREDMKNWGEADYGETNAAYDAISALENQIKVLKWVFEG